MALGNMVLGESIDNMHAHGVQILCVCELLVNNGTQDVN